MSTVSMSLNLKSNSFLFSGLCVISISRPFPCGRTLVTHLSSLISPHRPQITAPLRLVQGATLDQ